MRRSQKTLNLPVDVLDELEKEDNQSKKVEQLLREDYDL